MATKENENVEEQSEEVIVEESVDVPKAAMDAANRLLTLRTQTNENLNEMKIIKDRIRPSVVNGPIKTAKGVVSFVSGSSSKLLDKSLIRRTLIEKLHISGDRADAIIANALVDKIISSYVKVTPA